MTAAIAKTIASTFDAVLFDLDATLLDTESLLDDAISHVLERDYAFRVSEESLAEVRGLADLGVGSWTQRLVDKHSLSCTPAQLHDAAYAYFDAHMDEHGVALMPGVDELISSLATTGTVIGIVTSSTRSSLLRKLASHTALFACVRTAVTVDDVTMAKPDPSCYILAAAQLGVDITRCLVFEDSVPGVTAAVAAGATVVAVPHARGHAAVAACGAHVILNSLTELKAAPLPHAEVQCGVNLLSRCLDETMIAK